MSLLCRIGLHKWRVIGYVGLLMPWQVQQCRRCERGREVGFQGTLHYTPAEMRARVLAAPAATPTDGGEGYE